MESSATTGAIATKEISSSNLIYSPIKTQTLHESLVSLKRDSLKYGEHPTPFICPNCHCEDITEAFPTANPEVIRKIRKDLLCMICLVVTCLLLWFGLGTLVYSNHEIQIFAISVVLSSVPAALLILLAFYCCIKNSFKDTTHKCPRCRYDVGFHNGYQMWEKAEQNVIMRNRALNEFDRNPRNWWFV
jgi:magnesium-transporting ATPase (P-type)